MKIAIVGNLCNLGYLTLLALKMQFKCNDNVDLFISAHELNGISDPRQEDLNSFVKGNIFFWENSHRLNNTDKDLLNKYIKYNVPYNNKVAIIKLAIYLNKNYDYIIGLTLGSIIAMLSMKRFMWFATGSDLREWIFRKNKISAWLLKLVARQAHIVISGNDEGTLLSVKRLHLDDKHIPIIDFPVNDKYLKKYESFKPMFNRDKFVIFNPANQIWDVKGNNKLIKAVANLIKKGYKIELKLLDRGVDAVRSKNLVKQLGILDYVQWGNTLTKEQLFYEMSKADIIADQFILGDIGGIAREACCIGKPVLAYLNNANDDRPICNCFSIDEIEQKILYCMDSYNYCLIIDKNKKYAKTHYSLDCFGGILRRSITKR